MNHELNTVVVNAGCLLFLPEPQRLSLHSDVLDSLLYAQLAASKKHIKFAEFEKWNETRLAAALRFGWVLNASEQVSEPLPATADETLWSCLARALAPSVSAETLRRAETLIREVSSQSSESEALHLLRSQTVQSGLNQAGKLRVDVVLQLGFIDAHQRLTLAQLRFATRQPLPPGFLFDVLEPQAVYGNVAVTVYAMQLIEQVYAQFRSGIDAALSSKRAGVIMSLGGRPDV